MTTPPLGGKPSPQTPDEFIDTFLHPALALWRDNLNSKLLAICAVSQLDILVEVVFNHLDAQGLRLAKKGSDYRVDLVTRRPPLVLVSDAHDTHKHGPLSKQTRAISQGQRQISTAGTALFLAPGFHRQGKKFFGRTDTSFVLNDGTVVSARTVINEGIAAWNEEFVALGLPHRLAIPPKENRAPA